MQTIFHFAQRMVGMPGENVDAELFFQFDDGFRHPGLRREQRLGGVGQVEILADRFAYEA